MRYIITLSALFISVSCFGQTVNQLPSSEFEQITINSVSLREIMKTNGDVSRMPQMLGKTEDVQHLRSQEAPISKHMKFDGFSIGFSELLNAKGNLTRIEILKPKVLLNISGHEFYLGKDITQEIAVFKINRKKGGGKGLLFSPDNDSTIYLSVSFNDENIVTKIVFFVLT